MHSQLQRIEESAELLVLYQTGKLRERTTIAKSVYDETSARLWGLTELPFFTMLEPHVFDQDPLVPFAASSPTSSPF
jgi:hypothetical protein